MFTSAQASLDGAVFGLRVDVHKGSQSSDALGDLVFKENGETTVEIFFGGIALQAIECVPLLLQGAGTAHF